jgi:hypothetical protein
VKEPEESLLAPAHAGLFETLGDNVLAAGFDDAAADEVSLGTEVVVAQALAVHLEISDGLADHLSPPSERAGFFCDIAFAQSRRIPTFVSDTSARSRSIAR